jgi:ElaB/YqjD/DUF883 family membrane-anchored ribosome-binding protein
MDNTSNFNIKDWQLQQLYTRVALLEETLESVLTEWQHDADPNVSHTFKRAGEILKKYEFPKSRSY